MVYLPTRAIDSVCISEIHSIEAVPSTAVSACQEEAQIPYCWPPNGSRICYSSTTVPKIPLYWPPSYYNSSSSRASISIWSLGRQISQQKDLADGSLRDYLDLNNLDFPYGSDEQSLNTTIILRRWFNDSYTDYIDHQGPVLILVNTPPTTSSATATATASTTPSSTPPLTTGQIVGISLGSIVGLITFVVLVYSGCQQCCLACCYPGKAETKRVKAAERRRVREDRASVQPDVDAIKVAVARGEVWNGPVRSGGMWAARWPASPGRVARPLSSRGDDDIRAVGVDEERWMEEQRIELQRIEVQRGEGQGGTGQGEEITRAEEVQLAAYEAPPPKYTP